MQKYILFTPGVEIDPTDSSFNLVETDVVKPLEASSSDLSHAMIGNKEIFLPTHE